MGRGGVRLCILATVALSAGGAPAEDSGMQGAPSPRVPVRAGTDYLEVRGERGWEPLLAKGVNIGLALPGRWPTEFPQDATLYAGWFDAMSELGANAVRAYTLLPPVFYRTLAAHNATPDKPRLWLVQGVW